jgi:hypothetical protein
MTFGTFPTAFKLAAITATQHPDVALPIRAIDHNI